MAHSVASFCLRSIGFRYEHPIPQLRIQVVHSFCILVLIDAFILKLGTHFPLTRVVVELLPRNGTKSRDRASSLQDAFEKFTMKFPSYHSTSRPHGIFRRGDVKNPNTQYETRSPVCVMARLLIHSLGYQSRPRQVS